MIINCMVDFGMKIV